MSYPRNAASPERIAIGPVILIADGTPQSSGVTVTVRGQGGAEAGSAGTIAYGATGVIVYYTPTQAETDFTSFTVIASKAGCIPVCVTIITSASATPGYAGVDWGFVANKTTTNALTNTSIITTQDVNAKTWNGLTTVALPLVPTVAGRTLDVSATGEAGVDWANVGSPTTTLALTGTTIAVTQKVDVDTIKTNPVVNGGTITLPTNATLASTTNITAGTVTTATNLTNAPTVGDFTATMKTSIGTAVAASAVASVTGNVGGNVTGSVGSVTGAVGSVTGNVGGLVAGTVAGVTPSTAAQVAAVLTTALADVYAANGVAPTLQQAIMAIHQMLMDFAISSTSYTVKKLDNSATAFVVTLDSATTPTSAVRT